MKREKGGWGEGAVPAGPVTGSVSQNWVRRISPEVTKQQVSSTAVSFWHDMGRSASQVLRPVKAVAEATKAASGARVRREAILRCDDSWDE